MSWSIQVPIMEKGKLRGFLDDASIDAQMVGQSEDAVKLQQSQFAAVKSMAAIAGDWIPGPKVAGKIEGHANSAGDAMPHDAMAARVTIDLYQVRFAGE